MQCVVEINHRQYKEAGKTWTIVPYEEIIKRVKQLSPRLMIGDFGCGEAKLLEEFGDKRSTVLTTLPLTIR